MINIEHVAPYIAPNQAEQKKTYHLPYENSWAIRVPANEWNVDPFNFSFTGFNAREDFWGGNGHYTNNRTAFSASRKDGSQAFYYAVLPSVAWLGWDYRGPYATREFLNTVETNNNIRFQVEHSNPFLSTGTCFHETLGTGYFTINFLEQDGDLWGRHEQGTSHLWLSVSFDGTNDLDFHDLVREQYLN